MVKVNKTYSLDPETFMMLENYCAASDNWEKKVSRSKTVNDAIVWFLSGETTVAELVHSREELLSRIRAANMKLDSVETKVSEVPSLPWWRRLLLGR